MMWHAFHESLFFVGLITFLFSFLGLLIRDLDNPFGYYDGASGEDVSLRPLGATADRLRDATADHHAAGREMSAQPVGAFSVTSA